MENENVRKIERSKLWNEIHDIINQLPRGESKGDSLDPPSAAHLIEDLFKRVPNNKIQVKTIDEIIEDKECCPFPIDIIPNRMGINLVSVNSVEWVEQLDGQLETMTVNFIPDKDEN